MQTTHLALICATCMSLSAGLVYASTPSGGFASRDQVDAEPDEATEPARGRRRGPGAGAAAIATATSSFVAEAPTSVAFDEAPPAPTARPITTSKTAWRVKPPPPNFVAPKRQAMVQDEFAPRPQMPSSMAF